MLLADMLLMAAPKADGNGQGAPVPASKQAAAVLGIGCRQTCVITVPAGVITGEREKPLTTEGGMTLIHVPEQALPSDTLRQVSRPECVTYNRVAGLPPVSSRIMSAKLFPPAVSVVGDIHPLHAPTEIGTQ